jgi:hypothetical protein
METATCHTAMINRPTVCPLSMRLESFVASEFVNIYRCLKHCCERNEHGEMIGETANGRNYGKK